MHALPIFLGLSLVVLGIFDGVTGTATHCDRHRGNSEYRCGKDDYPADHVRITNRAGGTVSFKIGKWVSNCGSGGTNYENFDGQLARGASRNFRFRAAARGKCEEFYVHNCRVNGDGQDCVTVLTVAPA